MSIHNRAFVRLLILFSLICGVILMGKPTEAIAFTCESNCARALRSCDLACQFDPTCETTCDSDYDACLARCGA
jgi:hypothetical protein